MFRTYTPRPRPQVEAIHITRNNFDQVAAHFGAEIHNGTTGHGRPYMSVTLPLGNGHALRSKVGVGSVIVKHRDDQYTVTDLEYFDDEYQQHTPALGVDPTHNPVDRVTTAVQVLTKAGHQPAHLVGAYTHNNPGHNVTRPGFLILGHLAQKVTVLAPLAEDQDAEMDDYTITLTNAGYQVHRAKAGHLIAHLTA